MSFFSKMFSGKQQRLQQIAQATELQQQQQLAAQQQAELQKELAAAAADRDEQLRILTEQGNASLEAAAETARLAQQQADEANYRASLTPADSEDARQAADARMRKLQQKRGFTSTLVSRAGGGLGAAPVATRQLLGA